MMTIIFWVLLISAICWSLFALMLIYDRIKYGVWAMKDPDDNYHESLESKEKSDLK